MDPESKRRSLDSRADVLIAGGCFERPLRERQTYAGECTDDRGLALTLERREVIIAVNACDFPGRGMLRAPFDETSIPREGSHGHYCRSPNLYG